MFWETVALKKVEKSTEKKTMSEFLFNKPVDLSAVTLLNKLQGRCRPMVFTLFLDQSVCKTTTGRVYK